MSVQPNQRSMIRSWIHVWVSPAVWYPTSTTSGCACCPTAGEPYGAIIGLARCHNEDGLILVAVGPIPAGINAFDFTAPAPAHNLLPSIEPDEILGVTVIIITASYRDKEFVRVGYYLNTYYEEEEYAENPPSVVEWEKLSRNVLIEKPKVTRYVSPLLTQFYRERCCSALPHLGEI